MGARCAACGEANRDGARFCVGCGRRIAARCATCDEELLDGARFCDACGAPTAVAEEEVSAQARKTVTVVFADLQGSTSAQEHMDPESVRTLMERYYGLVRAAVDEHGGRLVKFIGDGAMVVFGVPEVAEDDALRAIRAADAIVTAVSALAAEVLAQRGVSFSVRAGVNTGEVVVDELDADVVGDAVNVAARLEGAAPSGGVVVGDGTFRLTRNAATFEAMPPLLVKGRIEPVVAHRLLAVDAPAELAVSVFVGRDGELDVLLAAFDDAVAHDGPRVAAVIGAPGVGKSRLQRELRARLDDRARVLTAQCDANRAAAFAPLADLLRPLEPERADLLAGSDDEARVASVLAGLQQGEVATPQDLFWAVRRVLEAAARRQPVVLLLDDLHWAEPLLLDLVEHLAEWITDAPVLIVALARPELRELRPTLAEPHAHGSTLVDLGGLDARGTEQLACELLGTDRVPAALLARLAPSTDGNPLFVRELVRMLVDDGVLQPDGDEWTLTIDADAVEVPPTIQSLLAARIDRLRPEERTVLERAAVIGTDVYRGALAALVPAELRGRLDGVLEALRRKDLLEPAGTYWIDEPVLRFHHVLIRDAAYRRLLREARAGLHERAAGWLVTKTGGGADHDEAIGYHLEQAQANRRLLGPLDDHGREVAADAATRLGAVARAALDRDDLIAAAGLAERAVACLEPDDPMRVELLLTRAEALLGEGDVAAATETIAALIALGDDDDRIAAWATCFEVQRETLVDPRGMRDAEPQIVAAVERFVVLNEPAGIAKANRVHASVLARLGRVADCEAALDRGLSAARNAGSHRAITSVLSAAPFAALWGPSPVPRAGGRCLDVIRLVRITTGARAVEATSIRCQAVLEALRGRFDAARNMLATARAMVEDFGSRQGICEVDLFAGIVELWAGDAAAALEHLQRAQDGFTAMGLGGDAAQAAARRARAALVLGRIDDALVHAAESERLGGQDLRAAIGWRAVRAEVLAQRGQFDEATALVEEAVARAQATDGLVDHAEACAALAVVRRAAGDEAGAHAAEAQARALYEQKGATARVDAPASTTDVVAASGATRTNAASRAHRRVMTGLAANDWDAIGGALHPDFRIEDHRQGVQHQTSSRDEAVEWLRVAATVGITDLQLDEVAVRGDRLALSRWSITTDGFESGGVAVAEAADDGTLLLLALFDADDRASALALLDECAATAEHSPPLANAATECFDRLCAALVGRDWTTLAQLVTDDVYVDDLRLGMQNRASGRAAIIEYLQAMASVGVDRIDTVTEAVRGDRLALTRSIVGAGDFEVAGYNVGEVDASGAGMWVAMFDIDDRAGALALLDERASALVDDRPSVANAATEALDRWATAMVERDWPVLHELIADDVVVDDQRQGFGNRTEGRADAIAWLETGLSLGIDRVDVDPIAVRGDHVALGRVVFGAADVELECLMANHVDAAGGASWVAFFDLADLARAHQILDERAATVSRALPPLANAATEAYDRWATALLAPDWRTIAELLAPDIVLDDRRRGVQNVTSGRAAALDYFQAAASEGIDRIDVVAEAVRGDRLVLLHILLGVGDFEAVWYNVGEVDETGVASWAAMFDIDDLAGAIEALDERYLAEEGRDHAGWMRRCLGAITAIDHLDAAGLRALFAEDLVYADRAPNGFGELRGLDQLLAYYSTMRELDPANRRIIRRVVAIGDHAAMCEGSRVSDGVEGGIGPSEVAALFVAQVADDGRVRRLERWSVDQLDIALARVDELGASRTRDNAASRAYRAVMAVFATGDWEAAGAALADDVVSDERRAGLGLRIEGREPLLGMLREIMSLGDFSVEIETLELRGDRAALLRVLWRAALVEADTLVVAVANAAGLGECAITFDPDDLAAATAALDAAAAAERDGLTNAATTCNDHWLAAMTGSDWDVVTELLTPTIVLDDRRQGIGNTVTGRQEMLAWMQAAVALGGSRVDVETVAIRGERLALRRLTFRGGGFEVPCYLVVEIDLEPIARGSWARIFDLDALPDALEALEERWLAGDGHGYADWLRPSLGIMPANARRDLDALRAMYGDDIVWVDHTPAGFGELHGVDASIEYHRVMHELDPHNVLMVSRFLAIADHIALSEVSRSSDGVVGGVGANEVVILLVAVIAGDGRVERFDRYPADAIDEARAHFDSLVASRQDIENTAVRSYRALVARFVVGDFDACAALLTADVLTEDRRTGLANIVRGRDATIGQLRSLHELGVRNVDVDVVVVRGDRLALLSTLWSGAQFEGAALFVAETDGSGRTCGTVCFDADALDDATAELERRVRRAGDGVANHASRRFAEMMDAFVVADWDMCNELLTDLGIAEDRRRGLGGFLYGREQVLGQLQSLYDLGVRRADTEVVAVRGDHLALVRSVWSGAQFEACALFVVTSDDAGRAVATVCFDDDALDDAHVELDLLFAAGEGAPYASWLTRTMPGMVWAHSQRDWDAMRDCYAPDIISVDHRPAGYGTVRGVDDVVAYHRAMVEIEPTHRLIVRRQHVIGDRIVLSELLTTGAEDDGGGYENCMQLLTLHDPDGRVTNLELFALDDLASAIARFHELAALPLPPNLAARAQCRIDEAMLGGQLSAVDELFTPDRVMEDRRAGLQSFVEDRAALLAQFSEAVAALTAIQRDVIAVKGDHAVLSHAVWAVGGYEIEFLLLIECDNSGLTHRMVFFDAGQLDAARAELESSVPG